MSTKKTNAMRILDKHNIIYETLQYTADEEHIDARSVSHLLGIDISMIYKTLILQGSDKNYYVSVINGADELDLKKTAKAFGLKSIEMIPVKDINKISGYIRGGCSPVGMKKTYKTVFDKKSGGLSEIIVSAGQRGLQIKLKTDDLLRITEGFYEDIIK